VGYITSLNNYNIIMERDTLSKKRTL